MPLNSTPACASTVFGYLLRGDEDLRLVLFAVLVLERNVSLYVCTHLYVCCCL